MTVQNRLVGTNSIIKLSPLCNVGTAKKGNTKTQQKYNVLQILALQHLLFQLRIQSGNFISIGHSISRSLHIQSSTQVPVVCNKCPVPHPALGTSLLPGAQGGDIKKQ